MITFITISVCIIICTLIYATVLIKLIYNDSFRNMNIIIKDNTAIKNAVNSKFEGINKRLDSLFIYVDQNKTLLNKSINAIHECNDNRRDDIMTLDKSIENLSIELINIELKLINNNKDCASHSYNKYVEIDYADTKDTKDTQAIKTLSNKNTYPEVSSECINKPIKRHSKKDKPTTPKVDNNAK